MKLLIDNSAQKIERHTARYDFIGGQLITPLTAYRNAGGVFAIDNGAHSEFDRDAFLRILKREKPNRARCLYVALPDVVGSARRTLEAFYFWCDELNGWPLALVCQDGIEDLPIPWRRLAAVFIGGSTEWKLSKAAKDVIKAAKLMGVHTHVGRINTVERWHAFESLRVDTCDGSGVSRFDWMLDNIQKHRTHGSATPLFGSDPEPVGGSGDELDSVGGSVPDCGTGGPVEVGATAAHDGLDGPLETSLRCQTANAGNG